jgi:LysM repeat protein
MKFVFTLICLTFFLSKSFVQDLHVERVGSSLYITHVVNPKENWYSISRIYSASPKELVTINQSSLTMGLAITQKIKIPLNSKNFIQSDKLSSKDDLVPLYHLIVDKEGLYRISVLHNKVPVSRLKEWNKLSSDEVKVGNSLIIGYLRVKRDSLSLSNLVKATPDLNKLDSLNNKSNSKLKPNLIDQKEQIVNTPIKQLPSTEKKGTTKEKIILSSDKTIEKSVVSTNEKKATVNEELFLDLFNTQNKGKPQNNLTGIADIFKSSSGWNDGKYYVLMNMVNPGTIVKVASLSTNRMVYAKVLGSIPPGKENEGLTLRISNAASAQLKAEDGRFDVKISW